MVIQEKMKKGIFFVRTPVQYYNAIEARAHFSKDFDQSILIVLSDYQPTLEQFDRIVDTKEWNLVHYPWKSISKWTIYRFINRLLNVYRKRQLKKICKEINSDDSIFWGNYNSIWLRYFHSLNKNKIVIIDDGFSTLTIPESLHENQLIFSSKKTFSFFSEKMFLAKYISLDLNRLTFFTSFHGIHPELDQRIIPCKYPYIKSKLKEVKSNTKLVYFIGQPLIFLSIIEKESYVSSVEKIFAYYKAKGFDCVYIPHRSSIHDYFPNEWNVKHLKIPVERLLFERNVEIPHIFCTFYSSGIYYLDHFYSGNAIKFDYWTSNELLRVPHIKNCYSYLEKNMTNNTTLHYLDN